MTTDEAVRVARIMVDPSLRASTRVVELLSEFDDIDWVEFFNELQDGIDTATHDFIFEELERRREGRA